MFSSFIFLLGVSFAQEHHHQEQSQDTSNSMVSMAMGLLSCPKMMVFDKTSGACVTLPMDEMGMWMVHGNAFAVQSFQPKPRGMNRFSVPNMLMVAGGKSYGNNYLEANFMMTSERWTFPKEGYPELLQIGEQNEDGAPYIDAQHPHSSPIMGLTLSDTIKLDGSDYLRIFVAPRGQATEGPVAFMHRSTGMVNPDAPLGHHIGQDVSHITSSVIGASLSRGKTQFEVSGFNGTEPEPSKVDLPTGEINSYAVRLAYSLSENTYAMVSASEVKEPEPNDPSLEKLWRYSASFYNKAMFSSMWTLENSFIYGVVNNYDHISALRSGLYEFWFHQENNPSNYWGRFEGVERTGSQLAIVGGFDINNPKWVYATTFGYTYKYKVGSIVEAGLGASITKNFLPDEFRSSYDGEPLSGKIFIQLTGMSGGMF